MWSIRELKIEARAVLKKCYPTALAVTIITSVLGNSGKFSGTMSEKATSLGGKLGGMAVTSEFDIAAAITLVAVAVFSAVAGSILMMLISGPMKVGECRYFLEGTQYRFDIKNLLHGFTCGRYKNVLVALLLREIYTALWTFLFIIPGIVKSFSYSMVPYIMAENPNISPNQAINISCRMTKGHKFQIFLLDLSFIGWYILGAFAFGIGTLFVMPYHRATMAQMYLAVRSNALDIGSVSLAELEYCL